MTLVLAGFVLQGLPFLIGEPTRQWTRHRATVAGKFITSADGREDAKVVRHGLRFDLEVPGEGRVSGQGTISAERYEAIASNDVVEVYWTGRRAVLVEDVRWAKRHRTMYRIMLVAAVLMGAETVRRGMRLGNRRRRGN